VFEFVSLLEAAIRDDTQRNFPSFDGNAIAICM